MSGFSSLLPRNIARHLPASGVNAAAQDGCQLKRSGAVKSRPRPQTSSQVGQTASSSVGDRRANYAQSTPYGQTPHKLQHQDQYLSQNQSRYQNSPYQASQHAAGASEQAMHARYSGAMRHVMMPETSTNKSTADVAPTNFNSPFPNNSVNPNSQTRHDAYSALPGSRPSKSEILDTGSLARTASMKAMRHTMEGYEFRSGADKKLNKFNPFVPTSNVKTNMGTQGDLKNPVGRVSATIFQNSSASGIADGAKHMGQYLRANDRIRIEERHGAAFTPGVAVSPIDMIAPGASILDYSNVMPLPKVKLGVDVGNWRESMMDIKAPVSPGGAPVMMSERADRKQAGIYATAGLGYSPFKSEQNSSGMKASLSAGLKAKAGMEYHTTTSAKYSGNDIGRQFASYASGSGHALPAGNEWEQSRKHGVRPTYEVSASVPLGPGKKFVSTDKRKDDKVKPEGKKMSLADLDKKLGPRTGEAASKMFENVFGKVPKDARKFSMVETGDGRVEIYGHVKVKAASGFRLSTGIFKAGNFAKGAADYSRLLFTDTLPETKMKS